MIPIHAALKCATHAHTQVETLIRFVCLHSTLSRSRLQCNVAKIMMSNPVTRHPARLKTQHPACAYTMALLPHACIIL